MDYLVGKNVQLPCGCNIKFNPATIQRFAEQVAPLLCDRRS